MDTQTKGNIPVTTSGKEHAKSSWSALNPIPQMERAFDQIFGRRWPTITHWSEPTTVNSWFEFHGLRLPSLDVIDRDTEFLVRAEVPGIEKKDLNVTLADNILTIKGHTDNENKVEKGDYYRHEISSSSFARSLTLPGSVVESKIIASLKDGILEVKLPKLESSKKKSIAVQ